MRYLFFCIFIISTYPSFAETQEKNIKDYVVKKGDTLYDIAKYFLNNPEDWQEIWRLNPSLKNPHLIYPGMHLKYFPANGDLAAILQITNKPEQISFTEKKIQNPRIPESMFISDEKTDIRTPDKTEIIDQNSIISADESFLSLGEDPFESTVYFSLPGFIYKEEVESLATIRGGSDGGIILGTGLEIILEKNEKTKLETNTVYSVLRFIEETDNLTTGKSLGYLYHFVGNIIVKKNIEEQNISVAIIKYNRIEMEAGDLVVPFIPTQAKVIRDQPIQKLNLAQAKVLSFGIEGSRMGGEGSLLFLDQGFKDGIKKGQIFKISQDTQQLVELEILDDNIEDVKDVGYVTIVNTTDVGAVGYITYASREIHVGDIIGRDDKIVDLNPSVE